MRLSRPVPALLLSLAVLATCRDAAPAGPPRANARALTAALQDVGAAPAVDRAAHLASTVAVACGPSCACLTSVSGCAASDPGVPAGWPAVEQCGRYLRDQLAAVADAERAPLAAAIGALEVPLPRLALTATLPAATDTRPLSLAPVVHLAAAGEWRVSAPPLVRFGAEGAIAIASPAPTMVPLAQLDAALVAAGAAAATPSPDADLPALLEADDLGPAGGAGLGRIGTGVPGTLGAGSGEPRTYLATRGPLAAGQVVIAADGGAALALLEATLAGRGGALAVRRDQRVDELAWTIGRDEALPRDPVIELRTGTVADLVAALDRLGPTASHATIVLTRATRRRRAAPQVGTPTAAGGLDRDVLRRVIATALPAVRRCYETALRTQPQLAGTVTARLVIAPTGAVTIVSADGMTPTLDACVAAAIKPLIFPPTSSGAPVRVSYPFRLAP